MTVHLPGGTLRIRLLPDGRELQVRLTPKGWIGYINGVPQNEDSPPDRKRDAQAMVYRILTDSNS